MDRIYIEQETESTYRISAIDRHRIYSAEKPGLLGIVFECSLTHPSTEDRSQIFFTLAPEIGADNFFVDLHQSHRTHKLNYWTIQSVRKDISSIFAAVAPLSYEDRLNLYSTKHSITATHSVTSTSKSLFSLVELSDQQKWKSGILQRCLDCIVKSEFRGQAEVYATIDTEYRRIMRFKLETEGSRNDFHTEADFALTLFVRRIIQSLGLRHSHDDTPISSIPESTWQLLEVTMTMMQHTQKESQLSQLSELLFRWSGAVFRQVDDHYCITVEPLVLKGIQYIDDILNRPSRLVILETPM